MNGISLEMFHPSTSRQKDTLWSMCLNLKKAGYDMKNESMVDSEDLGCSTYASGLCDDSSDQRQRIQADDGISVFRFAS